MRRVHGYAETNDNKNAPNYFSMNVNGFMKNKSICSRFGTATQGHAVLKVEKGVPFDVQSCSYPKSEFNNSNSSEITELSLTVR